MRLTIAPDRELTVFGSRGSEKQTKKNSEKKHPWMINFECGMVENWENGIDAF